MPDIPAEVWAAVDARLDELPQPDSRFERDRWQMISREAVYAAAPILAEAVAAKIEAHRAEWSQARPGQLVPTAWDRHMKIAARVAAGALSTDDDKKRTAAEAIARGDVVVCSAPETPSVRGKQEAAGND